LLGPNGAGKTSTHGLRIFSEDLRQP
jgi:ABC-type multidrug transport system ATPase subunit